MHPSVGIIITTYRNPLGLQRLLDNMEWAGWPDIPTYVFVDPPAPYLIEIATDGERAMLKEETKAYTYLNLPRKIPIEFAPKWGCMHGIIQYAMERTKEDWMIYVPDDVLFTRGSLYNELASTLVFGKSWVGAIQFPFWNARDLVDMSCMSIIDDMVNPAWQPLNIPRNPHWDHEGLPTTYVNVNGGGFAINREQWRDMQGWPTETWRLDEYLGYMTWKLGRVCIAIPGSCRVHEMGGAGRKSGFPRYTKEKGHHFTTEPYLDYLASKEAWEKVVGKSTAACCEELRMIMSQYGGDRVSFPDIEKRFS